MHPARKKFLSIPIISDCYVRKRMTPSFYIVGFQKCGTTSLYNYIISQPCFERGKRKEVDTLTDENFSPGIYLWHFPKKKPGKSTGNASHLITYNPIGIERIKNYYPDARLIVIMRNPVDRAFSQYNYDKASKFAKRRTIEVPGTFEEYVDQELAILNEIEDFEKVEELYAKTAIISDYGTPLVRGLYFYYLKRISDMGLQVHSVELNELNDHTESQLNVILDYLDVPQEGRIMPSIKNYNKQERPEKMIESTRIKLDDFFKPHNEKLFRFLGKSFNW